MTMKSSKIIKGQHWSYWPVFRQGETLDIDFQFTESCRYIHKDDREQPDWNKLVGLKKFYFAPHRFSVMVAWRYDFKSGMMELAAYEHDERRFPNAPRNRRIYEPFAKVAIGQRFNITISVIDDAWLLFYNEMHIMTVDRSLIESGNWWMILNWFGGTLPAPHNMEIKYLINSFTR